MKWFKVYHRKQVHRLHPVLIVQWVQIVWQSEWVDLSTGIFYNLQQCVELSRSPLGKRCEILSIGVQNKECIIYLINEMINLRLLTVATYDNYIPNLSSPGECYDLITWLKLTLPSTINIAKYDCCSTTHIRLWIL
jgi:hypothetical protein